MIKPKTGVASSAYKEAQRIKIEGFNDLQGKPKVFKVKRILTNETFEIIEKKQAVRRRMKVKRMPFYAWSKIIHST